MKVIEVKEEQKDTWNNFVKENGTLLQSWDWGDFKNKFSWKVFRLAAIEKDKWVLIASVLRKKLPFSKSFLYIPEGPIASLKIQNYLKILLAKTKEIAQQENAIFLRIEPIVLNSLNSPNQLINQLTNLHFRKAFEDIQPATRLWLDLTKSEEELLREMKHKGRYNIKIANKKGVNIKETQKEKMLDIFYPLYLETARRDKFSPRPKNYFHKLFDITSKKNYLKMFLAFYQNEPLAAIVNIFFGKYSTYLYGATSAKHRETMASYLVHWEAIKNAKQQGFKIYDFGAIASNENPKHIWAGLREFKMKFGGKQINLPGCYDLIYKPFWYNIFKAAEKIRRRKNA